MLSSTIPLLIAYQLTKDASFASGMASWITRKMEGYGLFPGYEYSRFSAMVLLSPWNSGRTPWSIDPQHWALMVGKDVLDL